MTPRRAGQIATWLALTATLCAGELRGKPGNYTAENVQPIFNTGTNPCYLVDGEAVCLPYIYVVGIAKAGTSALWFKLREHHQVHPTLNKEDCPVGKQRIGSNGVPVIDYNLDDAVEWGKKLNFSPHIARTGGVLLSACLRFSSVMTHYGDNYFGMLQQELGHTRSRVILSVRDFPEWLYSVFNFWCMAALGDKDCKPGQWRNTTIHVRSPQIFHNFVLDHPGWFKGDFRAAAEQLHSTVGPENLLVVSQHDLLERPASVLSRVEAFAGLERGDYPERVLRSVVNAGHSPGASSVSAQVTEDGMEPMLKETYDLLQERFSADCLWFKDKFDVCLPSCCGAREQGVDWAKKAV